MFRAPLGGGTPTLISAGGAGTTSTWGAVAVDGGFAYFNDPNSPGKTQRVPVGGTSADVTVVAALARMFDCVLDETYLYFQVGWPIGPLRRIKKDGSEQFLVDSFTFPQSVTLLGVDSSFVYFLDGGGNFLRRSKLP